MQINMLAAVVILGLVSAAHSEFLLQGITGCPRNIARGRMWFPSQCKQCQCKIQSWECTDCKTKNLGFLWSNCYSATIYGQVKCPGDVGYDPTKLTPIANMAVVRKKNRCNLECASYKLFVKS
ncbi:hypothetical protein Btru_018017 [Bulinus truncatus]|nr:hypothetical protein Btru_018017 [Bulinus truncatus]